jgi:hypothetical protein
MVSVGRDTGGSQFYVDLGINRHLDGRCVVFGRLIDGAKVLDEIEEVRLQDNFLRIVLINISVFECRYSPFGVCQLGLSMWKVAEF